MRHTAYRRIAAILIVLVVFAQLSYVALGAHREKEESAQSAQMEETPQLTLWYTDEKLNTYLVEAANAFEEQYGVQVTLQLVTAVDYIEHINTASISDLGGPDLFITSSELLEKARLAGLTVENDSFTEAELTSYFPQKAIDAATAGGKLVAYPFYFETCFLLYNKDYVEEVPTTIDQILNYAENFEGSDVTAKVEKILNWNVSDIFFNFFFISNYVNLGGETGDDPTQVSLSGDDVVQCLQYYQNLNAYFAIDADEVTTQSVLQDFIEGKTVFTIAKTDAIATIDAAIEEGTAYISANEDTAYFYGIAEVPDLTDSLATKGMSVTNSVVVNAYSGQRDMAKTFARFLTCDEVDDLYSLTEKMPVKLGVDYSNPEMSTLLKQYEDSVETTKITDLSSYWIEMEITFANIWNGNDVQTEIDKVTEQMMSQLSTE